MSNETSQSTSTAPAEVESTETTENTEESGESTEETADVAADLKETKKPEEKKKNLKKFKLKVDGKDLEEEVDLDNEEYIVRNLQLSKVAQKRMAEHAELQKNIEAFFTEFKKNPRAILADPDLGIDMKKLVAEYVESEMAEEKKTPEQREKEKLENALKEKEEALTKKEEEFKQKELERLTQTAYEEYDRKINDAIEASDLPKNQYTLKKVVDYMLVGLNEGLDVEPADVLPLVREEMHNDLKQMFAVMPDELIENLIGKDVIGRIRKKNVAKAKTLPPNTQVLDTGNTAAKTEKSKNKQSYKDFFRSLGE